MNERTQSKIKFVGLHAHSVAGSIFDGLGFPQDHMEFAYSNGSDALALTDHGNMNGLSYQVLHAKKMKAEGKDFKPIFGCEAYFIPSIEEWKEEYDQAMLDKKKAREAKKAGASAASVEDEGASKGKSNSILRRRRHLVRRGRAHAAARCNASRAGRLPTSRARGPRRDRPRDDLDRRAEVHPL